MRCISLLLLGLSVASSVEFTTVYHWDEQQLDYSWPSEAARKKAIDDETFNPKMLYPDFMSIYKDRIFLSLVLPWSGGTPVTFVSIPANSSAGSAPPKLAPFPSWQKNKRDDCDCVNWARGSEVDAEGRLWLVDQGSQNCAAKLWIFDVARDEVQLVHRFPSDVVASAYDGRWLRDVVLDETPDDVFAYVTDMSSDGIVSFSLKGKESWLVRTPRDGYFSLALWNSKQHDRQLLLAQRNFHRLLTLSVADLRARSKNATLGWVDTLTGKAYRMLMDGNNVLYLAYLNEYRISTKNFSLSLLNERDFYTVDENPTAEWPFTFAFDTAGNLWMTEHNRTRGKPQLRLMKAAVGAKSYLYGPSADKTRPGIFERLKILISG